MVSNKTRQGLESLAVCICTYNRSLKLKRLLNHLHEKVQIPSTVQIDFIVINNNSLDDTLAVANSFSSKLPLQVLTEKKQGLSNARNRAIDESTAEWFIFIDDDVLPTEDFFEIYIDVIQKNKVDFLGGRILLNWLQPKPKKLINEDLALLSGILGKFDHGEQTCAFETINELPRGANFAMSRAVFDSIGYFNTTLGVVGDSLGRAEETEYFTRAQNKGFNGLYCGKALCYHDALVERLNTAYCLKHGLAKGEAEFIMKGDALALTSTEIVLWFKALFQILKGRQDRYLQTVINIGLRRGYIKARMKAQAVSTVA